MAWVKMDDSFPDHPKIAALSDRAFRLHVSAMCLCARSMTDGHVPSAWMKRLGTTTKLIAELRDHKLWDDAEGGFQIHDFLKYNPSREQVENRREERAESGRKGGLAKAEKLATAMALATTNVVPRPVPSRPPASFHSAGEQPPEDSPALSESTDTGLNERMGIMIVANPKIGRDETLYSEAYQIATDHSYDQIQTAIQETRRSKDASGRPMAPYPSNWRRFLLADPKPVEVEGVRAILWNSGKAVGE